MLGRSLLDIQDIPKDDVLSLFETAKRIRHLHQSQKINVGQLAQKNASRYAAFIFFEPSTRTRASFEVASYKLGIQTLCPEFGAGSSLIKGESLVDTVQNIAAMDPDVMIIRYGECAELNDYLRTSEIPVINAGSGKAEHPTQALLDAFTIFESLGDLEQQKVLIVGDIIHGRVAQSNIKLLQALGAEVAICGPDHFVTPVPEGVRRIEKLEEAMDWASVVMALRIQAERHTEEKPLESYHQEFGITQERMKNLGAGILLHPGPINHGVEVESEVLKDPRCRVLTQVKNGVYIRAAVLSEVLGINI